MLEVSTLPTSPSKADPRGGFVGGDHHVFPAGDCDDFMVDDNLLDYIDFSCDVPSLFDADGDILPDLEVDPTELLAEFSSPEAEAEADPLLPPAPEVVMSHQEQLRMLVTTTETETKAAAAGDDADDDVVTIIPNKKLKHKAAGDSAEGSSTEDYSAVAAASDSKSSAEGHSKKKQSASAGNKNSSNGKRKVKVDWTPELHRRFVQAVEQLGIDKAVPSRILEIMGIDCLTRHNIASHLQKYRSHRKHLMAREAEAASWAQKRHSGMYAVPRNNCKPPPDAAAARPPWLLPTIGFPPPFCRPLHVWGHPPAAAVDASAAPAAPMLPVWPRHLAPPRPLPPWAHPPPVDPAYWHQQYNAARKWGPQAVTQGTPCVPPPPPMPPAAAAMLPRFPAPPVVPHPMYRPAAIPPPPPPPPPPPQSTSKLANLQLQLDAHPSKESIDAAIGDVLVKPWLPLPLGLKPPSLHSVMSELHKHGIPKVPPAAAMSTG